MRRTHQGRVRFVSRALPAGRFSSNGTAHSTNVSGVHWPLLKSVPNTRSANTARRTASNRSGRGSYRRDRRCARIPLPPPLLLQTLRKLRQRTPGLFPCIAWMCSVQKAPVHNRPSIRRVLVPHLTHRSAHDPQACFQVPQLGVLSHGGPACIARFAFSIPRSGTLPVSLADNLLSRRKQTSQALHRTGFRLARAFPAIPARSACYAAARPLPRKLAAPLFANPSGLFAKPPPAALSFPVLLQFPL